MYYINYINLTENLKKSFQIDDLKDIYTPTKNTYDVPSLSESGLLSKLDYGVSVLIPYNEGEDYIYIYNNSVMWESIDIGESELIGKRYTQIFNKTYALNIIEIFNEVYDNNRRIDARIEVFDESELVLSFNIFYIKENDKIYVFTQSTTKYNILKIEEDRLFNNSIEGLIDINQNREVLKVNNQFYEMFGLTEDEFKNQIGFKNFFNSSFIIDSFENNQDLRTEFDKVLYNQLHALDFNIKKLVNDEWKYFHIFIVPMIYQHQEIAQIRVQDITEQTHYQQDLESTLKDKEKIENRLKISVRQTEDFAVQLQKALNEKEELLKEVHDRVKNNLQLVSSFLSLELRYHSENPDLIIEKTRNRIEAMALIHTYVYKSADGDTVDIKGFILKYLMTLFLKYDANNIQENYYIDEDIVMSTYKMIPLGLILVELAFNTINYAFPNGGEGNFTVEIKKEDEKSNVIILNVFDDGVGLPDDVNIYEGLGFSIIKTLIAQLEASVEVMDLPSGFGLTITFENN